MKYSYNWIKELSGTKKTADEIAQLLLTHSFEIESIEDLASGMKNVVVGEILDIKKHPNADKLSIARVDVGEKKPRQIVFGQMAKIEIGNKMPIALAPTVIYGNKEIKSSELRGVQSEGMLCLDQELGLEKEGVSITFFDTSVKNGTPVSKELGLDDMMIDIKILPNRGHDCLSHIGIANEIRALEGNKILSLEGTIPQVSAQCNITINTKKCNRYSAVAMSVAQNCQSPSWIVNRLRTCEIKSINAVVDITNYVMLETGQPLHAFDAQIVNNVLVREAQEGEMITLLDDTEKKLTHNDIVITDGAEPIALAGVMGGKKSGITNTTTEILLESASFDAPTIRYTQRYHNLLTDAAFRFERDLDPNVTAYALQRAVELLSDICDAQVTATNDIYPSPVSSWNIVLSLLTMNRLLGTDIPEDVVRDILVRLGMQVHTTEKAHELLINIPTIRRDLITQEDLIEEIGRVYGYEKIVKKPLKEDVITPASNDLRQCENMILDQCIAHGFDEVRGYSFYAKEDAAMIGLDDENHIALLNPLTPDHALMRRSLVPELCRATKRNLSYFSEIRLCDIGRIYDPTERVLPDEKLILGMAVVSRAIDGSQFYEIKGLVEDICTRCNIGETYFDDVFDASMEHIPDLHPTRRAIIRSSSGEAIGWVGELTKKTHKFYGIKKDRIAVGELNIARILELMRNENFFSPLAKFPTITRDISMLVPRHTRVADIERVLYASGGDFLKDVDLFDIYDDDSGDERSLAFHIIFGADDHTLTAEEIDAQISQIITELENDDTITVRR
jgi:phenylalanyl-tRNA synthetase beta chain